MVQGAKMVLKENTFNFRLGVTRASTLFDKPVVYSVSALAITNEHFSYIRMNYMGLLHLPLREPLIDLRLLAWSLLWILLLSPLQSRVFEKSAPSKDYFIENKLKAAPYVNFSISVLPFIKAL